MLKTVAIVGRLNVVNKTTMLFLLSLIVDTCDLVDIVSSFFFCFFLQ